MSRGDVPALPDDAREAGALASELARAYRYMVTFYRDQLNMTGPEADARARGADDTSEAAAADLARIRDAPPDQVSWFDLNRVANRSPEAATDLWHGIKAAAREELASGHRAAQAHDWDGGPWQRARFLAIRDGFRADTPPRTGIESALLDMAAEAFSSWLQLSEHFQMMEGTEADLERSTLERNARWKPPHQTASEHTERIEHMAERAHLRMLRTIKALSDLRRVGSPVYVSRAEQVNVGQQQVNVVDSPPESGNEYQDE
ncbi:MAG: hypothetical protein M3412_10305 [Chloroflexota bacterium]|nr:hypothetical protein [Chloroflexota bacterium]